MMKMEMRLQKTQVSLPTLLKLTATGGSFDRSLYSEAGYTDFEAIIVGACGGMSGDAFGDAAPHSYTMNRSGGGGGGSIRLKGKLSDLPAKTPVTVGSPGTNGADSGIRNKAENGADGGDSSFAGYTAHGGKGAIGGNWDITTSFGYSYIWARIVGEGGAGGGNSQSLGVAGAGARQTKASAGTDDNSGLSPVDGTFVASNPVPLVIGGGGGGGGGCGAVISQDNTVGPVRDGAQGNKTLLVAAGDAANGNNGGGGGGANVSPVVGGPTDYWGSAGAGSSSRHFQGVVAIKIS